MIWHSFSTQVPVYKKAGALSMNLASSWPVSRSKTEQETHFAPSFPSRRQPDCFCVRMSAWSAAFRAPCVLVSALPSSALRLFFAVSFFACAASRAAAHPKILFPLPTAFALQLEVGFCSSHPRVMQAFSDMAKALNRSPVYLTGLQKRFELPTFDGAL